MRTIQWQFAKQDKLVDLPIYATLKYHTLLQKTQIFLCLQALVMWSRI